MLSMYSIKCLHHIPLERKVKSSQTGIFLRQNQDYNTQFHTFVVYSSHCKSLIHGGPLINNSTFHRLWKKKRQYDSHSMINNINTVISFIQSKMLVPSMVEWLKKLPQLQTIQITLMQSLPTSYSNKLLS